MHVHWDAQFVLDVFLYDYLRKQSMHRIAEIFRVEAKLPSHRDLEPVIDVPDGFLHEWWVTFYDMFNARQQPHRDNPEPAPCCMKDQSVKYHLQQPLHVDPEPAFSFTKDQPLEYHLQQSLQLSVNSNAPLSIDSVIDVPNGFLHEWWQQPHLVDPEPAPSWMKDQSVEYHLQQTLQVDPDPAFSFTKDQSLEYCLQQSLHPEPPPSCTMDQHCVQNNDISSRFQLSVNSNAQSPLSIDSVIDVPDGFLHEWWQQPHPDNPQSAPSCMNDQPVEYHLQQPLHVDPDPAFSFTKHRSLEYHLQQSLQPEPPPSCMMDQHWVQNDEISSWLQLSVNSNAQSPLSMDSGLMSMDNPMLYYLSLMEPVTLESFSSSSNQ